MIRYGRPREKAGASCCQIIPETKCIDPFGDRGELKDELMLCERDLGWIDAEEEGAALHSPRIVRPAGNQSLDLAILAALSEARTLVIDLGGDAVIRNDPLDLLPASAVVQDAVRARVHRGDFGSSRGRWQIAQGRCVKRLLEAALDA